MTQPHRWQIPCRDFAARRKTVAVFLNQGKIVVQVPPGEAAVLTPLEVGRLRAALRDAALISAEAGYFG